MSRTHGAILAGLVAGLVWMLLAVDTLGGPAGDAKQVFGARDRQRSASNLKQIGLALHSYHSDHQRFPPAAIYSKDGKPLLSWRVAILPYIEELKLYQEFKLDQPWDSEHNKKLLERMPKIYAPPAGVQTKEKHATFYQAFVGKGAGFEGNQGLKLTDFTDGTSNTILVVEAGEALPWSKPEDLTYDDKKELPKLGGQFNGDFHILIADGSVRLVKKGFNEEIMRLAITRRDNQPIDLDKLGK